MKLYDEFFRQHGCEVSLCWPTHTSDWCYFNSHYCTSPMQ